MRHKLRIQFKRIYDRLLLAISWVAGLLIVFLMVSVCVEVISRYFFSSPTTWVVEVAGYSILWITFLGAPWILNQDFHVKMDLLLDAINPRQRAVVIFTTLSLAFVICLVIAFFGFIAVMDLFKTGYRTQTVLTLPKWPIVLVIPFSMSLLCVELIQKLIGVINEGNK